jgi:hypothetical protein
LFALTAIVYPCVLALLCVGAGLLVDRASGRVLPGVLLAPVGAAALIGLSQVAAYSQSLASITPVAMVVVAVAGFAVDAPRVVRGGVRWLRPWDQRVWIPVVVYAIALAPVLAAGRTSFSAYGELTDSAFHMMGADFLVRHGLDFAHLDLTNSYGLYIKNYYSTGYPSGADTLFGGSAFVLGVPLIWAFQPFNAFMLALTSGPIWLLLRRAGLGRVWLVPATVTACVPALVYAYELIASVKEVTALPLIMAMGALLTVSDRWLRDSSRGVVPLALLCGAGAAVLGLGFSAWIGASALVLADIVISGVVAGPQRVRSILGMGAIGVAVMVLAALPAFAHISSSVGTAQAISTTSGSGNLQSALKLAQAAGTWLTGDYRNTPTGLGSALSDVGIAVTVGLAIFGLVVLARRREHAMAWWLVAMVLVGLALTQLVTNWVDAKTLMLSSPIVMVLAWSGVAGLQGHVAARVAAGLLGAVIVAGVLASDALQYNATNLAPTDRYDELATINTRFAGQGPALYTDFDEYALYVLRDLDVGGPNFLYPPPALVNVAPGHGSPVYLNRITARELRPYPLIVTRIDPIEARPPAAYRLLWRGTYYEVWGRRPGAPAEVRLLALRPGLVAPCSAIQRIAGYALRAHGQLVAARAPLIVGVPFRGNQVGYTDGGLNVTPRATVAFRVPFMGRWDVWLRGEVMPQVAVGVDGRQIGTIGGELEGNEFNPDTLLPLAVALGRGWHRLTFAAVGSVLAPGNGGTARVGRIFLTPAGGAAAEYLEWVPAAGWRALCGGRYDWVEAVRG